MRTLAATHLVPYPPDSGGKAVSAQTLECLARIGPLDVCAFEPPWARMNATGRLREIASRVVTLPLLRTPAVQWPLFAARRRAYYIWRDYSATMRDRVTNMRAGCDVLFADTLQMAPYISPLSGPKVLQQHNVESYLVGEFFRRQRNPLTRAAGRAEWRNLETFERDQCNAFDAVVVLSEDDRRRFEAIGVRAPMVVLPPGVDSMDPVPEGPDRCRIVHVGTGHWPPIADGLRWYLSQVHPRVRGGGASLETWLVGAPPSDLRQGPAPDGVRVLGYVDNLEPVYRSAAVFIVPLLVGGGVRLKILHALARGLAVVATSAAAEGLDADYGRHLLVADDPDGFARAVVQVATDAGLRRRLGEAGRAFVKERFGVQQRCAAMAALLHDVAALGARARARA
jgi:glycosyltransferase involved in cell wall biosynthesis